MKAKTNQVKVKKAIYKKWWFWLIVIFAGIGAMGSGSKDEPNQDEIGRQIVENQDGVTANAVEDPATEEDDGVLKSGTYTLPSGFKINYSDSVRNDVTGNWRISTTSDSFAPADYAMEYYETMFSSDDELHAIWNATLRTTTRISASNGLLFADTHEYVDGEEHDAKLLFSGMLLTSKVYTIATGEELVPPDETEPEGQLEQSEQQNSPTTEQPPVAPVIIGDIGDKNGNGSGQNNLDYENDAPPVTVGTDYVLNSNTMKFHYPRCASVGDIKIEHRVDYTGTRDEVIGMGYSPCGRCHP